MTDTSTVDTGTAETINGRHPVNVGHLVMGVAFLGLVTIWALVVGDVVEGADIRWLLPVPWVLAGAAGLVGLTVSNRRRFQTRQTGWVTPPDTDTTPITTEDDR
ncbi:MAG: hypothetical protein WKF50_08665 [Nocardioides sp.]